MHPASGAGAGKTGAAGNGADSTNHAGPARAAAGSVLRPADAAVNRAITGKRVVRLLMTSCFLLPNARFIFLAHFSCGLVPRPDGPPAAAALHTTRQQGC